MSTVEEIQAQTNAIDLVNADQSKDRFYDKPNNRILMTDEQVRSIWKEAQNDTCIRPDAVLYKNRILIYMKPNIIEEGTVMETDQVIYVGILNGAIIETLSDIRVFYDVKRKDSSEIERVITELKSIPDKE